MIPGVIPTPIGEFAEYTPSNIEFMVVGGVWAIGFFVLTVLIKGAVAVMLSDVRYEKTAEQLAKGKQPDAATT